VRLFKDKKKWETVELGEVCSSITDGSHNPPKGVEASSYLMLSSKNIFNNQINYLSPRYLREADFVRENKRTNVELDDVLLTIVGTIGRCAVVTNLDKPFTLQRSVAVLKPNKETSVPRYLMYVLISLSGFLNSLAHGVAQKGIYLGTLSKIRIPLPPLEEQQRIVEVLDRAENIKRLRQQAIETTQRIAPALFYEMFGNPVKNEKGWEVATLDEISSKGQYGLNAPALKEGKGVRYIRITDIDSYGTLREDSIAYVDSDTENIDKYWLSSGDILIARSGATAGKSMIYKGGSDDAVFAGYLIRFQINKEVAVPEYVASFLQTRAYWSQLNPKIRVAAQPNVNARELGSLILPLPLFNEQRRFVDKLNELRFIQLQQSQSVTQTEQLSSALSAQLLAA
jgi:type I restriction enzyme, S subunit